MPYADPEKARLSANARAASYRHRNRLTVNQNAKVYRTVNWFRARISGILGATRLRAERKGIEFNLDVEYVLHFGDHCALTGIKFSPTPNRGRPHPLSPSIDRLDQNKGYVGGNIRLVLFAVNSFRGSGTDEQMLTLAEALLRAHKPELFK